MTAATHDLPYVDAHIHGLDDGGIIGKTGLTFYKGAMVGRDPNDSGLLKPLAAAQPLYEPLGVVKTKLLGDGAKEVLWRACCVEFANSGGGDAIPATLPRGWPVYAVDDKTVALTWGSGTRAKAGVFGGMSKAGNPLVWVGIDPYGLREILVPVTKGHADLTAAATSQSFTLYTAPGPMRVASPPVIDSLTVYTGGGASAVTLAIGISTGSDVDAIGDEKSIFTGGAAGVMTAGVSGFADALIAAGVSITATFASDVNVADLSAGAIVAFARFRPGC